MNVKKITIAVVALCSTSLAFSQAKFGVKAGLNIATLTGKIPAEADPKSKIGFHAGVTMQVPFGASKFSLASELLVSTQGLILEYEKDSFEGGVGNVHEEQTEDLSLTYINLPIMLRYNATKKLSFEAGPQFGYVVGAKNKIDYTNSAHPEENLNISMNGLEDGTFTSNGVTYSYQSAIKRFDFGLKIGGTYDITKALFVQTHYNFGFSDVDKRSTSGGTTNSLNLKNSVFQFSLGYKFQ